MPYLDIPGAAVISSVGIDSAVAPRLAWRPAGLFNDEVAYELDREGDRSDWRGADLEDIGVVGEVDCLFLSSSALDPGFITCSKSSSGLGTRSGSRTAKDLHMALEVLVEALCALSKSDSPSFTSPARDLQEHFTRVTILFATACPSIP
jgi:hypothetical protein